MVSTLSGYQQAVRDISRSIELVKADPVVDRETKYYQENIGSIKSIEDFVNNDRLFASAMKAHGLEEMTYAKAFVQKALEGGRDDDDAFVNRIADARYRDFVETFDFNRHGAAATSFTKAGQGTVDKYLRQTLEENEGATNEGVRLALYFERKAPSLESTEAILADRALSVVVRGALQIPEETAFLDIDKQVELLEERLDIEDFKDPDKLAKFIERYVALRDAANPPSNSTTFLFNQNTAYGVSTDMLLTIQTLK